MSGKSEFDLQLGRYLVRNSKALVLVLAPDHGEPLLEEIRKYEQRKGADYAAALLMKMETGGLNHDIRKINDLDAIKLEAELKRRKEKELRGTKYECQCGDRFYDLERDDKNCPKCGKPKSECKKLG